MTEQNLLLTDEFGGSKLAHLFHQCPVVAKRRRMRHGWWKIQLVHAGRCATLREGMEGHLRLRRGGSACPRDLKSGDESCLDLKYLQECQEYHSLESGRQDGQSGHNEGQLWYLEEMETSARAANRVDAMHGFASVHPGHAIFVPVACEDDPDLPCWQTDHSFRLPGWSASLPALAHSHHPRRSLEADRRCP